MNTPLHLQKNSGIYVISNWLSISVVILDSEKLQYQYNEGREDSPIEEAEIFYRDTDDGKDNDPHVEAFFFTKEGVEYNLSEFMKIR